MKHIFVAFAKDWMLSFFAFLYENPIMLILKRRKGFVFCWGFCKERALAIMWRKWTCKPEKEVQIRKITYKPENPNSGWIKWMETGKESPNTENYLITGKAIVKSKFWIDFVSGKKKSKNCLCQFYTQSGRIKPCLSTLQHITDLYSNTEYQGHTSFACASGMTQIIAQNELSFC